MAGTIDIWVSHTTLLHLLDTEAAFICYYFCHSPLHTGRQQVMKSVGYGLRV